VVEIWWGRGRGWGAGFFFGGGVEGEVFWVVGGGYFFVGGVFFWGLWGFFWGVLDRRFGGCGGGVFFWGGGLAGRLVVGGVGGGGGWVLWFGLGGVFFFGRELGGCFFFFFWWVSGYVFFGICEERGGARLPSWKHERKDETRCSSLKNSDSAAFKKEGKGGEKSLSAHLERRKGTKKHMFDH